MATRAKGSFGTKLYRKNDAATYELVPECTDFDGLGIENVTEEATNHDSPNGFAEHVATGVKNIGDLSFDCNLIADDTVQAGMLADAENGTLRSWRLVYWGGTKKVDFDGFVSTAGGSWPVKSIGKRPMAIKVTGQPVRAAYP